MSDRETSRIRRKLFPARATDLVIEGYVARSVEDPYGRRYDITLPRIAFALCEPAEPRPAYPDARDMERRRQAAEALYGAVRLARLIPKFDPPTAWVRSAQFEGRA